MTGQLQSPVPHPPAEADRAKVTKPAVDRGRLRRHFPRMLRKLSTIAPLAAGYGAFQAVLSSLPPSLSSADIHYLFAVACGIAVGAVTGCAVLLVRRTPPKADPPPSVTQAVTTTTDLMTMIRSCHQTFLRTVVTFDDPHLGTLTGWSHSLHEAAAGSRPTAYGTAYGLKLAMVMGDQDGRLDRAALVSTLWKLRRPDGGWASRTQGAFGRPEVTAVVLGALASAGCDAARLAEAADVFESMIAPDGDAIAMRSTYIVSSIIRELARIRPHSPRLAQLRTALLAGAVQDPQHDNLLCWSARLDTSPFLAPAPSVAHTALAVVALSRACVVGGDDVKSRSALEQATRWLICGHSLGNQTEQIKRPVRQDFWEPLTVRLYTAAWVAKALIAADSCGLPDVGGLLDEAANTIADDQCEGVWQWGDVDRPVWMSYQGMSALQACALRRWSPVSQRLSGSGSGLYISDLGPLGGERGVGLPSLLR